MRDIHSFEPLFGSWYFEELIGRGSYGDVYRARSDAGGRRQWAAIKHISVVDRDDMTVEQQVMAINREININELFLSEPNIVGYQETALFNKPGLDGLDVFIRMELLTTLTDWNKRCPMQEPDVVRMGIEICNALNALENVGILHRDVKNSNIFVSDNGTFKLGDFGVAKSIGSVAYGMTLTGAYNFMAPEIAKGGQVRLNADLYSLGIVLFRLTNGGKAPFLAPDSEPDIEEANAAVQRRMRGELMPAPAYASPELAQVIQRACAYRPQDRYQTANEMAAALRACRGFGFQKLRLPKLNLHWFT